MMIDYDKLHLLKIDDIDIHWCYTKRIKTPSIGFSNLHNRMLLFIPKTMNGSQVRRLSKDEYFLNTYDFTVEQDRMDAIYEYEDTKTIYYLSSQFIIKHKKKGEDIVYNSPYLEVVPSQVDDYRVRKLVNNFLCDNALNFLSKEIKLINQMLETVDYKANIVIDGDKLKMNKDGFEMYWGQRGFEIIDFLSIYIKGLIKYNTKIIGSLDDVLDKANKNINSISNRNVVDSYYTALNLL